MSLSSHVRGLVVMDITEVRRFMGHQLEMPEPITDGLSWYRVYRLLLRKLHVVMGLNVNHSEMHGIYGIECGPFRNTYEWTRADT